MVFVSKPEHVDEGVDLELRSAVRPHLVDGAEERDVGHDDDVVLRPVGDLGRPVKHTLRSVTHHVAALPKKNEVAYIALTRPETGWHGPSGRIVGSC